MEAGWNIEHDYYLVPPLIISSQNIDPVEIPRNPVTFERIMSVHGERLAKSNMSLCKECFIPIILGNNEYCEEHQSE
jgi:hypothetical protein